MSTQPLSDDLVRDFVISAHSDLDKVKAMLAAQPELLDVAHPWSETDRETAIMAAAHMGDRPIAEYLLERGAPLAICTAAMMGDKSSVEDWLAKDAILIHAHGAHMIPLLAHAALSGSVDLMELLVSRGAHEGEAFALHNAVTFGYEPLARWLLENTQPDLTWKNWQDKTALQAATDRGDEGIAKLLREQGATE
jgi:ankyrin repeat protein